MRLTLIRHGRPAADLTSRLHPRDFATWLTAYDEAGIDPSLPPPVELLRSLTDCRLVFTSPARRAQESAALLAPHLAPQILSDAAEAPLPTRLSWPFTAQPATLIVLARTLWLLGLANARETKSQVRARADRLAAHLATSALTTGPVALVGHGYLHIFTARSLTALGWHGTGTHRHGYWSASHFSK